MKNKKLPSKPSALLKLAMVDLEKVEADPRYVVNMGEWHLPYGKKCEVCLAGSVLAKEEILDINEAYGDGFPSRKLDKKLVKIDLLREGNFPKHNELPDNYCFKNSDMDNLSQSNRPQWKLHMATIIGILEAEGL